MGKTRLEPTEFQRRNHSLLQIEVDRQVRSKVLKGIELLKERYGDGWVDKINLSTFQISDGAVCALGQVYGSYGGGKGALAIDDHEAEEYGFIDSFGKYEELQSAWLQELYPVVYNEPLPEAEALHQ